VDAHGQRSEQIGVAPSISIQRLGFVAAVEEAALAGPSVNSSFLAPGIPYRQTPDPNLP
jgi:hypothetical protein